MLAFVGLIVPEFVRVPGTHPCYAAKNIVEAHNACAGEPEFPFIVNLENFYGPDNQVGPLFQVYAFCGAPVSERIVDIDCWKPERNNVIVKSADGVLSAAV